MIVVDASAVTELLSNDAGLGPLVLAELYADAEWAAPNLLIVETANALRGLWLGKKITDSDFDAHLDSLSHMSFTLYEPVRLLPRIRELARNATAYDAAYLVLAEQLQVPLITIDAKLGRVPGVKADVRVIAVG